MSEIERKLDKKNPLKQKKYERENLLSKIEIENLENNYILKKDL